MDTINNATSAPAEDEIDLLDLLVVIAENIKLLIFGPLLIGAAALGIAFYLPQTFESQSILVPNQEAAEKNTGISGQVLASFLTSADVINAAANDLGLEPDMSTTRRIKAIQKRIRVSVGKQDQLVTLVTQGQTPEAAQALNATLWKHVFPMTLPRPAEMERLRKQLTAEKDRLESGEALEQQTGELLATGKASGEATSRLYGELLKSNTERLAAIAQLESRMHGLTAADNWVQQPSLPEEAVAPKKSLIAIAATFGSGFLLLVFVFMRQALRTASNNPEQASKVQRLRKALGFKS